MKLRKKRYFDMIVSRWTWRSARRRRIAQFLFAVSMATAVAAPAWAENDPTLMPPAVSTGTVVAPAAPEAAVPAAQEPAASAAGDVALPEVLVTGERGLSSPKYTEPLRDIPQTITVIPETVMREQGATTLRDVLRNVPGISIQAGEGGVPLGDNLSIRGFAARTDIFVDGIRDFGGYSRDSFNFEQVEVVKGPASTYAGRGSTGGSINMSTKSPRLKASGDASFRVGNADNRRVTLDVNRPIEAINGAAFRLNALSHSAGVPGRDVTNEKRWGVAPSLAFGLGMPTRLTLSYLRLEQDNMPDYGIPWVTETHNILVDYRNAPPPVDFSNFYGLKTRDFEKVTTDVATVKVERDLGSAWTLRNLTRAGKTYRYSLVTAPRFVNANTTNLNRQFQDRDQVDTIAANVTDLTGRFNTGAIGHALAIGLEVSKEESTRFRLSTQATPTADLFNPNPEQPYAGVRARSGEKDESTADTVGVYVFDTVKVGDRWEFPFGVRWDSLKVNYKDGPVNGAGQTLDLSRTDRMMSWRAAAVFKPSEPSSIYAGYGTSFNPASEGLSLSTVGTNAGNLNVAPEKNVTMEFGAKWDVRAGFSVGAAVFRTEKTNARTPNLVPGEIVVLDGEQRVDGVEFSASGELTEWWSVFAAATFLKSEVAKSNTPIERGLELSNTPKQSYSGWTTFHLPAKIDLGAGVQAVGSRFNNTAPLTRRQARGYVIGSLMAGWEPLQGVAFQVNVDNATDVRYIDRVGGGHFVPGPGRSVALTTSVKF